ncbi:hypothetical protein CXG81DRAFT_10844 [Caulochytrium protostelioides]|uniref:HECT-type E3 ubiquitin transferase n=1 Tax=Caulochytrium protostelioides TaxID=1555241 RepID=A0A4P9XAI3_9FUNG|nr:hypothetical protein CXG81DRAFT_10844 [Caulochytrium protostelioides]|eukprot:RKP02374.1 hypothetical protein CXG81DRAFT_10844 [Caulochytrium protostelioides]
MNFSHLWKGLGENLETINEKPDLLPIATVLLPLIESFMVVSKPYVMVQHKHENASVNLNLNETPSVGQKTVSELLQQQHQRALASSRATSPPLGATTASGSQHPHQPALSLNEELFFVFTEEHRKILNTMVRHNPSLMSGSFSLLILNPKVLEFDCKRTYFTQQLHRRSRMHQPHPTLQVNVRRQYVFEESFHQLHGRRGKDIAFAKLNVRFTDEEGVDAGGVTREWFSVLARQMFNPDYALFKPSAVDKITYQPNRASWVNPDHLSYFKFVGRIIGKAIHDGRLMDCYFTRSFYKQLIDVPVDYKDMEAFDPDLHKSLVWMLNNDITDIIDETFSIETEDFGEKKTIELKPGGAELPVTEENKREYVDLLVKQKLTTAIKQQIDAFMSGFNEVIPKELIRIFNEQELELLISGLPDIDIDDWKNNTEYVNYTSSSTQIQWFWRAIRSFSQEEKAKVIQFATGTSKVPLEGFAQLQGSSGVQKFNIHKDFSSTLRLPSAHTCFNQVDLPEYNSYEQLRSQLLTAISECGTGFGLA